MKKEESPKRLSRLRFNFGFLIEARSGTSRKISIDYPAIDLDDDLSGSPLSGTFEAIRNSKGIYITGELKTKVPAECVRCLTGMDLDVPLELDDLFYYPAHQAPPGEYGVGEDGFIDLAPLVRELSLLTLPMQPLCHPDCQGLCMECGANLNAGDCECDDNHVNPRFEQLQQLLAAKEKQQE